MPCITAPPTRQTFLLHLLVAVSLKPQGYGRLHAVDGLINAAAVAELNQRLCKVGLTLQNLGITMQAQGMVEQKQPGFEVTECMWSAVCVGQYLNTGMGNRLRLVESCVARNFA